VGTTFPNIKTSMMISDEAIPGRKIEDRAIAAPWMEAQMGNGLQG